MIALEEIKKHFRGQIALSEPLSKYTSFRIGGPADYYLEPADRNDVVALVEFARQRQIPMLMMGCGSNMLVSDDGVHSLVVNLEQGLNSVATDGKLIRVDAGVRMTRFVDYCIHQGKQGVEMLAGIPGTIGGAVVMNAGAYGGEIADHLVDVDMVRDGGAIKVKKQDMGFSYRRSAVGNAVVLGASFRLPDGDTAQLIKRRRELLVKRNEAQPLNLPNSGSIFKNPEGKYAAKLVEEAGLRGTRRGKAQISEKHGNFIVNLGGAKALDVLDLIRLSRTTVKKKFNVDLEPEVKFVGFPEEIMKEFYS